MQRFELTTWERVSLLNLLYAQRGDLGHLRKMMALADVLEMDAHEREEVGFRASEAGFAWEDQDKTWEIEMDDHKFKLLVKTALEYNGWQGRPALAMLEKLEEMRDKIVD